MTLQDFSTQFDVLWNNISSNLAPGLSEYEKSVFLTKALSLLINEYFNNRTDGVGGGFDGSQRRQYDFSSLIKTSTLKIYLVHESKNAEPYIEVGNNKIKKIVYKLDNRSLITLFPPKYFLSVNEIVKTDKYQYSVLAISYDEYQRLMLKPYAYPVKKALWRLINTQITLNEWPSYSFIGNFGSYESDEKTNQHIVAELIGKIDISDNPKFIIRYIEKPTPIILDDLNDYGTDITIDGITKKSPCILPEETHQEILERAVTLAKIAWLGSTATLAAAAARQQKDND